jgi:hypothetical protein
MNVDVQSQTKFRAMILTSELDSASLLKYVLGIFHRLKILTSILAKLVL